MLGRGAVYVAAVEVAAVAVRTRRADRQRRGARHLGDRSRRPPTRSGIMRSRGQCGVRLYLPRLPVRRITSTTRQEPPAAPQRRQGYEQEHTSTHGDAAPFVTALRNKRCCDDDEKKSSKIHGTHSLLHGDCYGTTARASRRRRPPQEQQTNGCDVTTVR